MATRTRDTLTAEREEDVVVVAELVQALAAATAAGKGQA